MSELQPRIRVAVLLIQDEMVLTVRHEKAGHSYYLLPGGGVEPGETLTGALIREVREETGSVIDVGRVLTLNDTISPDGTRHLLNVTFAGRLLDHDPAAVESDDRVTGYEWVSIESLERLDLRPRLGEVIARYACDPESFDATYLGNLYVPEPAPSHVVSTCVSTPRAGQGGEAARS